jgi:glutamine synthetase
MEMSLADIAIGKVGFIEQYALWSVEQRAAVHRIIKKIEENKLELVRVSVPDQHGILRNKTLTTRAFKSALRNGVDFTVAPFVFDTANSIVFDPFVDGGGFGRPEMSGLPDVVLVPDPLTFRILPWVPATGWILGNLYFNSGKPLPWAPRGLMQKALDALKKQGFGYVAGLEVEWYLTKLDETTLDPDQLGGPGKPPPPPRVRPVTRGYQYLMEAHLDEIDGILQILRHNLEGVGLPLRTMEDEWGPGQLEFTFDPLPELEAADAMMLLRSAIKQICRRHGYHATFMCKPGIPSFFASGWHLHQSLINLDTKLNAFTSRQPDQAISEVGRHFMGGLLAHAGAACVFSTPTINGYKRAKPFSLAPDRATWGIENRGAMLRVQGGLNDLAAHIENRIGEPAANPYLYMAAQIFAGLDGIKRQLDPGLPSEAPYAAVDKPLLPKTLVEATALLKRDELLRKGFGDEFIDYIVKIKEFEWDRFVKYLESAGISAENAADTVTDWEQREYFELY